MKKKTAVLILLLSVAFLAYSEATDRVGVLKKAIESRSNLPLVVIETNAQTILNEPKITVSIKVIDNGPGKTNEYTDVGNQYDGPAGIKVRGQSSQFIFPKKKLWF